MRSLIILFSVLFLITGCRYDNRDVRTVDFSQRLEGKTGPDGRTSEPLKVAVSAMLSPRATFSTYEALLRKISDELGVEFQFHQRRTYTEINNMLEAGQLDFAFICSGAYIALDPNSGVELLAVPIVNGKPSYQAHVIVNTNSGAQSIRDLQGTSFAFTDLLSNAGYLYAIYRINEEGGDPSTFFSSTIFTNSHDASIQMVGRGLVDGAVVHANMYEYLKQSDPSSVANVRILETSPWFGINPVVASFYMENDMKERVREILKTLHLDESWEDIAKYLQIEKFTDGNDANYDGIRMMRESIR